MMGMPDLGILGGGVAYLAVVLERADGHTVRRPSTAPHLDLTLHDSGGRERERDSMREV